jgi:hypothetical protein
MTSPSPSPSDPTAARRARRTLILIAAAVVAPVALSYFFYYLAPRAAFTNYGELLPTAPLPDLAGTTIDGQPFRAAELRGKWTILVPAGGACDAACGDALYATRQARTMQGKDMDRVARAWIVTDDATPPAARLAEHPGMVVARVDAADARKLPKAGSAPLLVDPLGNVVLAWPARPDPKALAKDLSRLLKASRIG